MNELVDLGIVDFLIYVEKLDKATKLPLDEVVAALNVAHQSLDLSEEEGAAMMRFYNAVYSKALENILIKC